MGMTLKGRNSKKGGKTGVKSVSYSEKEATHVNSPVHECLDSYTGRKAAIDGNFWFPILKTGCRKKINKRNHSARQFEKSLDLILKHLILGIN